MSCRSPLTIPTAWSATTCRVAALASDPPAAGTGRRRSFVADPRGPFRLLAVGETLGMPSASGYGSVQIWRYAQLLYILRHGRPYPHRKRVDDMAAAGVWNLRSPIVDMLNIRYLIWNEPPSDKWGSGLRRAAARVGAGALRTGLGCAAIGVQNRRVMPRAYLTQSLRWAKDEADEARWSLPPISIRTAPPSSDRCPPRCDERRRCQHLPGRRLACKGHGPRQRSAGSRDDHKLRAASRGG